MATDSIGKPIIVKTEEQKEILRKVLKSESKPVFSPPPDLNIAGLGERPGLHRTGMYMPDIPYELSNEQDKCSHPLYVMDVDLVLLNYLQK